MENLRRFCASPDRHRSAWHAGDPMLDEIIPEGCAFYVMDRGYIDFERLFVFALRAAFFVVRTKKNIVLERRYSHEVDKSTGVRSDHTVILTAINSVKTYRMPCTE